MQESAHEMGLALTSICMSKSRFNATLRNVQAVGLPVDAFRTEATHQVRKQGSAVSGDDSNMERVTDKLQIYMRK